ncbi:MAG TPA: endonuclease domain-containing protein [Flavobacteriales bacterium]|nr:endonuclease domain-containing protein [Flavobacteriales bacterium]HIA12374.1 endonuclease domain-containing protein [Flavobacteriales bacterium]HIO71775.1 endonuclease domain-containing protein [Flavobacteriales bacterium]
MRTVEYTMFYGAKANTFQAAKTLRNNETEAEKCLWERLNKKQLGYKFRRQHPIKIFIADFYCHQLKLVIEVDGGIHLLPEQREYDIGREEEMEQFDIRIIRFTNKEVLGNIEKVIEGIKASITAIEATR